MFFYLNQLAGDPAEEVANTRRFRGWTTDAVYMGNVHKIAIATDCRDLRFVTISSNCLLEEIHLYGTFIPNKNQLNHVKPGNIVNSFSYNCSQGFAVCRPVCVTGMMCR